MMRYKITAPTQCKRCRSVATIVSSRLSSAVRGKRLPHISAAAQARAGKRLPCEIFRDGQIALRLDPDKGRTYTHLLYTYAYLNRLDEAKAVYQRALARNLDDPYLHQAGYYLAFWDGNAAEMDRQTAWAAGRPGVEDSLLSLAASTELFKGNLRRGRELTQRAVESALRNDQKELATTYNLSLAWTEAAYGDMEKAHWRALTALNETSSRDLQVLAALTLASTGETVRAQALASDWQKRFPLDTVQQGYWLPAVLAAIEINRRNPSRAIETLQTTTPLEMYPEGNLGTVYLRGLAYLLQHQGSEAASEFQTILDHRALMGNSCEAALAHLQIGRAYAMQGDTAKARSAYQDFLTLWKDADPDIPILKQAKTEYAKLQ